MDACRRRFARRFIHLSARAIRAVSAPALASHPRGAAMGAAPARCGSRHQSSSHLSRISLTSVLTSTRTVPRSADSAAGARPATHTSRAQAGSRPSRGAHGARAPATAPGPSRRPREKHKQRARRRLARTHGNLGFNRVCGRIPDCRFGISICGRRFRTMFRWCMVGFPEPIRDCPRGRGRSAAVSVSRECVGLALGRSAGAVPHMAPGRVPASCDSC